MEAKLQQADRERARETAKKRELKSEIALRRKHPRRRCTAKRMLLAIKGSCGDRRIVAATLGVTYATVSNRLNKAAGPDWDKVRAAMQSEIDKVGDAAEATIQFAIEQRLDINTATTNARWLLSRQRYKDRQLGDVTTRRIEGGDTPIRVQTTQVVVNVHALPLEAKRSLLAALERQEKPPLPLLEGEGREVLTEETDNEP
jgi:hypothetical protein